MSSMSIIPAKLLINFHACRAHSILASCLKQILTFPVKPEASSDDQTGLKSNSSLNCLTSYPDDVGPTFTIKAFMVPYKLLRKKYE